MTSAEHSVMVFLLQAIEVAPEKATDLCFLARGKEYSEDYMMLLQDLEGVARDPIAVVKMAQDARLLLRTT